MPIRAWCFIPIAFVLSFGAPPASADDMSVCVQRELADRGFNPGLVDGTISQTTLAAADAFAAATTFPMPPLAITTAAEWCGVLAGWDKRHSGPRVLLDEALRYDLLEAYRNDDPAALPRGIYFGSSVSASVRALILADLSWLADMGALRQSDALAAIMRIEAPLTGARLVGWLLEYVMAIATDSEGCRETLIMSGAAGTAQTVPAYGRCEDFSNSPGAYGGVALRSNIDVGQVAVVRQIDDVGVVIPEGRWRIAPVVYLNPGSSIWSGSAAAADTDATRLDRLGWLFHEASHVAYNYLHTPCRGASPTVHPLQNYNPHQFCDEDPYRGSYFRSGLILALLAENCSCSFEARNSAYSSAIGELNGVTLPLIGTLTAPNTPGLRELGLAGNTYTSVPPKEYFDILSRQIDEYTRHNGCPCGLPVDGYADQIRELRDLVERQEEVGNLAGRWSVLPPASPSIPIAQAESEWARVWVLRASRSAGDGYNVPLLWVTHCSVYSGPERKCEAGPEAGKRLR